MTQGAPKMEGSLSPKKGRRMLTGSSLKRMRLPKRFWSAEFARITDGKHKDAIAHYFRGIAEAVSKGYGMILWGKNDTGKTGAAAVCLKEARRQGFTGLFITANQYISDVVGSAVFNDAQTVKQRCMSVGLLVLDDLGKEQANAAISGVNVARMFEDLLRHRSANLKSTIITTNLNGIEGLEERYGKSFTGLVRECAPFVEMVGPSQRERGREDLVRFFTE